MKSPRHRITLTALPSAYALIVMFAQSASLGAPIVFMNADTSSSRLFRFDNGAQTFGVPAPSGSAFHGLTVLNGNVLVADYGGDAIRRYTPNGVPAGNFAVTTSPTFLESDSGGNIYTNPGPLGQPVATRFNSAGVVTQLFTDPGLHQLAGMDADAAGNVYVADIFGSTRSLFKFTPAGVFLTSIPLDPSIVPRDMAIDEASNRLYLADGSSSGPATKIRVFNIAGAVPVAAGTLPTPAGATIEGIHFAAESGNILVTDFGVPSNIPRGFELSPTGTLLQTYTPTPASFGFDITTFVIPEPAASLLAGIGVCAICFRRSALRLPTQISP
jgi:hypothetical protein